MENSIKELRKQHHLSQEALAQKLGVSRQTIISIEKGKYHPSLPLAIQIARCFGTHVEDVFHLEE
ncbi:helix-turn-helix transcriptional regulator [Alkalicoccobacillus plakortidis]|uniref:Helix-turn-helix transcriptional regulator n=1 Tax=Alkalicoccobacillus plakortidis TaxID=444060 RepID=A0ABT0XG85_9BACI|nr:helix-turn-helix transcriptional regulator [Alkalicoccobacillus plakortidis]MCM2674915.1 helix-turn-helix transcriptional regulator [Alkalicoccobacillus plakortidis]